MRINKYNEQETIRMMKEEYLQEDRQQAKLEGETMLASLINNCFLSEE